MMHENVKHQQAFEYYYMLGPARSYSRVADAFAVAIPTVGTWAKQFSWKERVKERDNKNMAEIREANDNDFINDMKGYRKIIRASVADYIKRLKDGKVKIETSGDFIKLVKLDMELCGFVGDLENDANKNNEDTTITFVINTSKNSVEDNNDNRAE